MNINNIKNIKPNKRLWTKVISIIISIVVILVCFAVLSKKGRDAQQVVDIVVTKNEINAKSLITDKDVEKYSIIKKEFKKDMLTYDKVKEVVGKYSLYYMRKDSPIFQDQISEEKPVKNEWLYNLSEQNEVLTLPYSYISAAGDILTPGDNIRVRVNYKKPKEAVDPKNPSGNSGDDTITEMLFNSINVKDLLNSSGHSIYEVYKEVLKLNEQKRQEVMKTKEFISSVMPKALILEAAPEQVNQMAKYESKDGKTYIITLLSRHGNKNLIDQLPTVEKEIESWITTKQK